MKQKNYKKSFEILSFVLLSLSLIAIGIYLYKNSNIREKLSFASTIGLNSKKISSPSTKPLYKLVDFQTGDYGDVEKSVKLNDGREIVGGYTAHYDTEKYEFFPVFWDRRGKVLKYLFNEKYKYGFLYDLNENGSFTTQYYLLSDDNSVNYASYLHNIDSDELIELTCPDASLSLAPSSLLDNGVVLKTKEYLETLIPDGACMKIFENTYSNAIGDQVVPSSINNHGDVAGSVYVYENGRSVSKGVVWLASNEHRPLNISSTIAHQLGALQKVGVSIYFIDDNKNIWANISIDDIIKVGYFEYIGENEWKLKQSWSSQKNSYMYPVAYNSDNLIIKRDDYREGDIISNNLVYLKKKDNIMRRLVSRNPYLYKLRVEDFLQGFVDEKITYLSIQGINKNNELLGNFYTENASSDSFTIDLDTMSVQIFSELIDDGLIIYPADMKIKSLSVSSIDDAGNIYVRYFPEGCPCYQMKVAMLEKL